MLVKHNKNERGRKRRKGKEKGKEGKGEEFYILQLLLPTSVKFGAMNVENHLLTTVKSFEMDSPINLMKLMTSWCDLVF